jgi:peptide/nickel transport system permease protein
MNARIETLQNTGEGYAARIWRHFQADSFARNGLRIIIMLFVAAALAPFLANSHAIVRISDGQVTFPVFRSLEAIEWRFLLYLPMACLFFLMRRSFLRFPRFDLASLTLLCILAWLVAVVMPIHFSLSGVTAYQGEATSNFWTFSVDVGRGFWILVIYGLLLFFVTRRSDKFLRWPQLNLTFIPLLVIIVELALAFWHPINDPTNDRDRGASFKLMPLIPYSPIESSKDQYMAPSIKHWCGTDETGRDVAARMLHGARTSLAIGFVAQSVALIVGTTLGGLAGYYRSWLDIGLSRVMEVVDSIPQLLLILVVIGLFDTQNNMFYIMVVIGLTNWTGLARLVRGEFLRIGSQQFPQAARALGANDLRVILHHLLPNSLGPILVSSTFGVASAILIESSLSFLGFGMQAPTPSWGDLLSEARQVIDFAWWLAFFPGLAILITIMSYNFVGEGLRDAVDPRLKVK